MTRIDVHRALISVSDKTGLADFAETLAAHGVEIVSSGGTATYLEDAGIAVIRVEDVTGAPEMLGGRVKTLHPHVHGGILADLGIEDHRRDLEDRGIDPFQLVVVNLYPFEETVAGDTDHATAIENIDIGGPTLIRAAAKNHAWVTVVVSPERYDEVAEAVAGGGTTSELREDLAREAFLRTARYDAAIVNWLDGDRGESLILPLTKWASLRYGENPHQAAGLYSLAEPKGWWARGGQIQGKAMSFNNYADADAAWKLVNDLPEGSVAILKHMNACGAAWGESMLEVFRKAWACDPLSAFGGVIALNAPLDGPTARAITENFVEVVMAPQITEEAAQVFAAKKNVRVFVAEPPSDCDLNIRTIDDGLLIQRADVVSSHTSSWRSMSRTPTATEQADLEMAWIVAAHTKSNAIVLVKDGAAVGVGAGDQSRVGAAERALARAGDRARGAVCASDAFFPFRDGPDTLAAAGVTAIVEPGGSVRDDDVIESAREHDMALLFTGERHFRH
ncbi:IMP cyclohydrolase / Phosphoribosylaminoimidazolecarboxamide formyltransferase [hydrothermal vent metagenome]|uniref:IMP cyclohydrolase / Phosphoribosylaminoimidazolecarboxamide formyltransferase n=1 Tax=hydrothermal vent metagenome TaxID=652676 RepID=A0A3B0RDM5_9ZZZZ